jgi:hypothetical protein
MPLDSISADVSDDSSAFSASGTLAASQRRSLGGEIPVQPAPNRAAQKSPEPVFPGQPQQKQPAAGPGALLQRGHKQRSGPEKRSCYKTGHQNSSSAGQRKPVGRPPRGLPPQGHPHAAEQRVEKDPANETRLRKETGTEVLAESEDSAAEGTGHAVSKNTTNGRG